MDSKLPAPTPTHMPAMLVVAAALLGPDGRVCLQQRPAGKHHAGLWEFPGGKVEPGEHPAAALCRELGEELGIAVDAADLFPCGFAASPAVVILLYRVVRWTGQTRPLEGGALTWVEPGAVAALPLPPLDYPLAAQLLATLSDNEN